MDPAPVSPAFRPSSSRPGLLGETERPVLIGFDIPQDGSGSSGVALSAGVSGNDIRDNIFLGFDGVATALRGDGSSARRVVTVTGAAHHQHHFPVQHHSRHGRGDDHRPVHDALMFLLDHLPPQMHLFIATRADPPLHLPRLRAPGQLNELRAADLRFSPEEAATFLNDMMGLGLSAAETATLDARTEGWVTGLQMAALSMRGRKDITAFISAFSGSHRFVLDYLVEEVLDQQPDDVREFLLKTSILKRMNAPLCDAVSEIGDQRLEIRGDRQSPISNLQSPSPSQEMLKRLEQANLFVIPLDDERCWYRYHHLFADLLRNQLALTHPDQLPGLHQRASGWFEREGMTEETISHAFAARDDARVARLIEKYARELLHLSKYNLLCSWIEALPEEMVQMRPWLCVYQAWTRHWTGTREGGEECLDAAERALSSPPPQAIRQISPGSARRIDA